MHGVFNPFDTYLSNWIISLNMGVNENLSNHHLDVICGVFVHEFFPIDRSIFRWIISRHAKISCQVAKKFLPSSHASSQAVRHFVSSELFLKSDSLHNGRFFFAVFDGGWFHAVKGTLEMCKWSAGVKHTPPDVYKPWLIVVGCSKACWLVGIRSMAQQRISKAFHALDLLRVFQLKNHEPW